MTKPDSSSDPVERLILESVLDPSVSTEAWRAELRAGGIDVDGILQRAKANVGAAVRERLRAAAEADQAARRHRLADAAQSFASWTIEQVRGWLRRVAEGELGADAQGLALPCFRNRQSETMTDEELRHLAAEIKAALPAEPSGEA